MHIEIKHRITGAVLFSGEFSSLRSAVEAAVKAGANLTDANLAHANLTDANLTGANLEDANLAFANLAFAKLAGAKLAGADITHVSQCLRLPVGDPRGYDAIAVWTEGAWLICAGCRRYGLAKARAHWGNSYSGYRSIGDRYLAALDWLERQPTPGSEESA